MGMDNGGILQCEMLNLSCFDSSTTTHEWPMVRFRDSQFLVVNFRFLDFSYG